MRAPPADAAKKIGTSPAAVRKAVKDVGNSRMKVESELKNLPRKGPRRAGA